MLVQQIGSVMTDIQNHCPLWEVSFQFASNKSQTASVQVNHFRLDVDFFERGEQGIQNNSGKCRSQYTVGAGLLGFCGDKIHLNLIKSQRQVRLHFELDYLGNLALIGKGETKPPQKRLVGAQCHHIAVAFKILFGNEIR